VIEIYNWINSFDTRNFRTPHLSFLKTKNCKPAFYVVLKTNKWLFYTVRKRYPSDRKLNNIVGANQDGKMIRVW